MAESSPSPARIRIRTAMRVAFSGLNVRLQLGRVRYDVAPGDSKTLKVGLAKGSRGLADRKGGLTALATASTGPKARSRGARGDSSSCSAAPPREVRCGLSPGTTAASSRSCRRESQRHIEEGSMRGGDKLS